MSDDPTNTPRAEADVEHRQGWWRRLDLVGPTGRFLRRQGVDVRLFGVYLHLIDAPDPGLDLHDHPWPFATIILRGGYTEEHASIRDAVPYAVIAERVGKRSVCRPGVMRVWRRGSVHRMGLADAHRIIAVEPGTVTLVLRGRKVRPWGFYLPTGWVDQRRYDYAARRPVHEHRMEGVR